ncbi:sulfotransferase [Sulfurimonas sp. HSL-3221]|uniref:sulfotransferase n=1 Tax=Sulfurimonadaceae TaxID=2771471 RepID=UPI001E4987EF|nr:sulfotransferase [Sulfurimonas sp. HSL-3221]UFS62401.1 sulfotransferase [Sulfurimonas sp. HSL-3221]
MKGRDSLAVRLGRVFQNQYRHFGFLDDAVLPFLKRKPMPLVCIVAPPRSGSTLTYQVLTAAFENSHLANLTNLLYATPAVGLLLQQSVCAGYETAYRSKMGFVDGICGEAEGLKFWSHWMGQGLMEDAASLDPEALSRLKGRLERVSGRPYITGYLGHAFSMELLRQTFDRVLFIHLKRDLLSNSYSLLKLSGQGMVSTVPAICREREYAGPHARVVDQIMQIHRIIERDSGNDTIQIAYEALCEEPDTVLKQIAEKASELGIALQQHKSIAPFEVSRVAAELNADTQKLAALIGGEHA